MNCNFMKILHIKNELVLPFKIIEGRTISQRLQFQGKVLVLPDTDYWFNDLDQKQNLKI